MNKTSTYLTFFCSIMIILLFVCGRNKNETKVSIKGDKWYINGRITNEGSPAEGLLMNVRMVNSVFEDRGDKIPEKFQEYEKEANADNFMAKIPEYISSGVNAFTIGLQGGMPGYEGAINSAFESDGTLRLQYMERVGKVIRAVDECSGIVILSCFYQRQHSHYSALNGRDEIKNAVRNTVEWIRQNRFENVVLEISNEYRHPGYRNWKEGRWLMSSSGQVELIQFAKSLDQSLLVSTSGMGDGQMPDSLINAADFITIHFNSTPLEKYSERIDALKKYGKPVICNEDDKTGEEGATALALSVLNGCSWGYMNNEKNQYMPFIFEGIKDDTTVYGMMKRVTKQGYFIDVDEKYKNNSGVEIYFPPPDSQGGWRTLTDSEQILQKTDIDRSKLDEAFEFVRTTTRNGGLLVVRHGWLVYENYFGKGQRDATPNLASCGKSFTSISVGILMNDLPELFPEGLDQKIFTPEYLPDLAFPLKDPRMSEIKLGQLLSFSAGIRGNNPVYVNGEPSSIDPVGPDGWYALVDSNALGISDGRMGNIPFSTKTLWCEPGGGYSYATASIHIASIILRNISGIELQDYVNSHLAKPMGWGRWGFGYRYQSRVSHTPGGGGIALRSTDMLRFCYMLLHKGRWEDKQIVPEEYVQKAKNASPYNPHFPYSLQFNVNTNGEEPSLPKDAFWKSGSGGHCFYIVPSLDLIVWKLGGRDGQYGSNDTGLPQSEPADNKYGPTEKISTAGNVNTRTLELVINSIIDKKYSPLTTHHSPLTTHHSPLTTHHSLLTTHY